MPRSPHAAPGPSVATGLDPVTARLVAIWQETLGQPDLDQSSRFSDTGADSLGAIRLRARMRREFGRGLSVQQIFAASSIGDLARTIRLQEGEAKQSDGLTETPSADGAELRWRTGVLVEHEYLRLARGEAQPQFLMDRSYRLRGPVDGAALEEAINRVAARHPVLRARFSVVGDEVHQEVVPGLRITLARPCPEGPDPVAWATEWAAAEIRRPFALGEAPLLRLALMTVGHDDHVLVCTIDHLIGDESSLQVIMAELSALYLAVTSGVPAALDPAPSYATWARRQRELITGAAGARILRYWRSALPIRAADLNMRLPGFSDDTGHRSADAGVIELEIDESGMRRLRDLAADLDVTLYTCLFAHLLLLVVQETGSHRATVMTNTANRNDEAAAGVVGMLTQSAFVSADVSAAVGFRDLARSVGLTVSGLLDHNEMPFLEVRKALWPDARDYARFRREHRAYFALYQPVHSVLALPATTVDVLLVGSHQPDRPGFEWWVAQRGTHLVIQVVYPVRNFRAEYARLLASRFRALLVATEPDLDALVTALHRDRAPAPGPAPVRGCRSPAQEHQED